MIQKITILNNSKLYLKFLSELQQTVMPFESRITVRKGEVEADAKSLMEILGLIDGKGNRIEITAEGEDAALALEAIRELAAGNFLKLNQETPLQEIR